jgi:putative transposase
VELAARLEPQSTCAILSTAGAGLDLSRNPATVVADSGVENVNGDVDALLGLGRLRRVLAQVEVTFSNSMVEAWWRSLKHNWLFLNRLDTLAAVERLVSVYVQQHNAVIPHSAFHGQTPDEMYFGTGPPSRSNSPSPAVSPAPLGSTKTAPSTAAPAFLSSLRRSRPWIQQAQ